MRAVPKTVLSPLEEDDSGLDGSNMPENKRALHNAMERKRRDSIKVGDPNTLLTALIKVPGSNQASPTMTLG